MKRVLKKYLKRSLRYLFESGQRLGLDILPRHFYSEIPDIVELKKDGLWKRPFSMVGLNGVETNAQLAFVESCCAPHLVERQKQENFYLDACQANGEPGFGPIEADFLFCFIVSRRPKKIIQIGCGVSTAVVIRASEEAGYQPEIIAIDPYPTDFLRKLNGNGRIQLIEKKAQEVDLRLLTNLGEDGFLFVDSTHCIRPGSEVTRIILEALPGLKKGSWVHFHDIYFPYDYSRSVLKEDLFFWRESVLLHAFLAGNAHYTIRAALSLLHYFGPSELGRFLPNYRPAMNDQGLEASEGHFPSSLYLQVI